MKLVATSRRMEACEAIETKYVAAGWICCACWNRGVGGTYNGNQRATCKQCDHTRCEATR